MEINRSYYGDDTELKDTVKTVNKLFNQSNYAINQQLDNSITATASTANFAPYNSVFYLSIFKDSIGKVEVKQGDIQQIALTTTNYKSIVEKNWYNYRWSPAISNYLGAENFSLISGYKFLYVMGRIRASYENGSGGISYDYLNNITDLSTIHSVYMEILPTREPTGYNIDFSHIPVNSLQGSLFQFNSDEIQDVEYLYYTWYPNYNGTKTGAKMITLIGSPNTFGKRIGVDNSEIAGGSSLRLFNYGYLDITNDGESYYVKLKSGITREDIYSVAATIGLPFSPSDKNYSLITNDNCYDEDFYIPTITDNGFYNGDYTHGRDNANQKQIKENWNADYDAPYKHGANNFTDIDKNKYADKMERGSGRQAGVFNNIYAVNESSLKQLQKILNVVDNEDAPPEIYKNMKFMGNNPMNCITSINWFPFPIMRGISTTVIIGSTTTNIPAFECTATATTVDMGFCDIKPIHKNHKFLNFEPYSYYFLYVPFCGWSQLDSRKIYENNIHLYMNIDYVSGVLQSEIWINGTLEKTIEGVASNPVSIQAADLTSYQNSRFNSVFNAISSVGTLATGNVVGGAVGLSQNLANFLLTPINYNDAKAITAMLSTYMPTSPCIIRYSVNNVETGNYGNSVGYACEFSDTISNLSGYTVVNNFNTNGITATDTEKQLIKTIAENGFYI